MRSMLRSRVGKTVALIVAACLALAAFGVRAGEVYASTLAMTNVTKSFLATAEAQENPGTCISSFAQPIVTTAEKGEQIEALTVITKQENRCDDATLAVTVTDDKGGISTGTLRPMKRGELTFTVQMTGSAQNHSPKFAFAVY